MCDPAVLIALPHYGLPVGAKSPTKTVHGTVHRVRRGGAGHERHIDATVNRQRGRPLTETINIEYKTNSAQQLSARNDAIYLWIVLDKHY